jgi:hypothetical protein
MQQQPGRAALTNVKIELGAAHLDALGALAFAGSGLDGTGHLFAPS